MKRREFTKQVKAQMFQRATVDGTTFCEGCGQALKTWEFDHTIAEALVVDKAPRLTADDGKLLGPCCHRGDDGKTKQDVKKIAKAKRVEAKRIGATRPKQSIQSAGFPKAPPKASKIDKSAIPPLPRRGMFVRAQ